METGQRVLVVDDETSIRRYLRAALTAQGLNVYEAADGQEALSAVLAHRPDLGHARRELPSRALGIVAWWVTNSRLFLRRASAIRMSR